MTKVLIVDTIFTSPTGDGTAILRDHPSHAKVQPLEVQREYLHFKVVSNGPAPQIEPATSAVMRSTDWANPACSVWDSKQCKISKYVHRNTPLQHWRVPAAWCSQIKHYTVVLSHSFRPCSYEGKLSRKRGSPSSWVNGKNSWPLCQSQQCSHELWLSRLDRVDPAGRAKVFVWRNVGSARKVTLHLQKGKPAARRVILAKPTSFSHLHGSTHFF